jgi:hypothetical protein
LIHHNVMLGAFAVDQIDLNGLALMDQELGIHRAIDVAADADIDHAAVGDAGAQREDCRRMHIARHRALFHRRRRRGRFTGWRRNRRTGARHLVRGTAKREITEKPALPQSARSEGQRHCDKY